MQKMVHVLTEATFQETQLLLQGRVSFKRKCPTWPCREVAEMVARMRAVAHREREVRAKLNLILAEMQGRQPSQASPGKPAAKQLAPAEGVCMPGLLQQCTLKCLLV